MTFVLGAGSASGRLNPASKCLTHSSRRTSGRWRWLDTFKCIFYGHWTEQKDINQVRSSKCVRWRLNPRILRIPQLLSRVLRLRLAVRSPFAANPSVHFFSKEFALVTTGTGFVTLLHGEEINLETKNRNGMKKLAPSKTSFSSFASVIPCTFAPAVTGCRVFRESGETWERQHPCWRVFAGCPRHVAQIFNLPYRRFSTCWRGEPLRCLADCKSAIQQIANLRYVDLVMICL